MQRRHFLRNTAFLSTIPSMAIHGCNKTAPEDSKIKRVRTALLTMQRESWEQGVASHAFIDLGDDETAIGMALGAIERQLADGRPGMIKGSTVTDPVSNGEAILFAYIKTGDAYFLEAHQRALNFLVEKAPRSATGTLYHFMQRKWIWIDSMYMAPPFLAVSGEYAEAYRQIKGFREVLYDPLTRLYKHQWDDESKTLLRDVIWSSGVGWTAAGIARTLLHYPDEMNTEKQVLTDWLKELIDAALNYLRPDGFFHDIMNDPDSFVETNSAQMMAYAIYSGISNNWIDQTYLSYAEIMRNAADGKVDGYGYVRDVAGSPNFDSPGESVEGQAFYLLMEAARSKIIQ